MIYNTAPTRERLDDRLWSSRSYVPTLSSLSARCNNDGEHFVVENSVFGNNDITIVCGRPNYNTRIRSNNSVHEPRRPNRNRFPSREHRYVVCKKRSLIVKITVFKRLRFTLLFSKRVRISIRKRIGAYHWERESYTLGHVPNESSTICTRIVL